MAQESPILKGQFRTFLSWTWFWPCRTFFQIKIHTVTSSSFLGQSFLALNLVQNTQISIVHD